METRSYPRTRPTDRSPRHQVTSYWDRTQWPLQSLYFLLPLLVAYEIGTAVFAPEGHERLPPIYAERMLGRFFEWVGVAGYYLPGIVTVVALLCWHMVRRDPWRPEPRLYLAMFIESAVLASPLFVFSVMMTQDPGAAAREQGAGNREQGEHWVVSAERVAPQGEPLVSSILWTTHPHGAHLPVKPHAIATTPDSDCSLFPVPCSLPPPLLLASTTSATTGLGAVPSWQAGTVFAIGAGIYEELVFRLILIALLHLILSDVLALPQGWSAGGAIGLSAVAFALYHPFDSHLFWQWSAGDWGRFFFYTLAGLYFAAIYVYRGFGIVAAAHALYDVMVIAVHFRSQQ